MKVPKTTKKYCPKCKAHQDFKVSIYKKSKERRMAESGRRYRRKKSGYSGQPKPIQHNQCKVNKKVLPMYTCPKCGYKVTGKALRQKKYEILTK